jgi:hypothetical protein
MNIHLPTRDEIHTAFEQGEKAVMDLFLTVEAPVEELTKEVEKPAEMLKELQARLGKNRRNSGKPPTSPKRTNRKNFP